MRSRALLGLLLFLFHLKVSFLVSLRKSSSLPQKNNHQNISILLDSLLRGYDNSIRPNFGGPPAVIEVDIMVRSMGPISEMDMTYSMDCYFRQSWIDRRLSFSGHDNDTLALSITMLERIWKPDTYFYNGKQSYLHTITTPNQFVRLYHDGRVLYSSRLTIKAGCPMNLEDFPMDIQRCPLKFGSFGYTKKDVLYRWNSARQVAIAEDMKLSQFDLIDTPAGNQTYTSSPKETLPKRLEAFSTPLDEYSMLLVSFHLQRHMGNFLIQVYGPCVLLVVLSWVSFWLNREATADRVSLGITTVLTMTFLGLEARKDLPKVSYPTALDYFVFLSFSFIFATIIQFAIVHYFTKYGSGECYFSADLSSDDESDVEEDDWRTCEKIVHSGEGALHITSSPVHHIHPTNPTFIEIIPLNPYATLPVKTRRPSTPWGSFANHCFRRDSYHQQDVHVNSSVIRRRSIAIPNNACRKKKKRTPRFNSVSKIDRASRVVFPMFFVTINLFYWYAYLLRTHRIENVGYS
ncbi:gamma-aminobutyric acid receptor alpha-like [Euwallacea fornicatus]|uniref:gamma-aminobutyric acid receptor alpha-like n=1 Tax=Euwallacea fornicatus TaxID=995702 RepID=UPI00338FA91A